MTDTFFVIPGNVIPGNVIPGLTRDPVDEIAGHARNDEVLLNRRESLTQTDGTAVDFSPHCSLTPF